MPWASKGAAASCHKDSGKEKIEECFSVTALPQNAIPWKASQATAKERHIGRRMCVVYEAPQKRSTKSRRIGLRLSFLLGELYSSERELYSSAREDVPGTMANIRGAAALHRFTQRFSVFSNVPLRGDLSPIAPGRRDPPALYLSVLF